MTEKYMPPKVWKIENQIGGAFASINRPVSGATHVRTLPVGTHPLQLYSMGTPNGQKITMRVWHQICWHKIPIELRVSKIR